MSKRFKQFSGFIVCIFLIVACGCDTGGDNGSDISLTADAGVDQMVNMAGTVLLDGTASTGPEGAVLTYAWAADPYNPAVVTLNDADTATASFTAPSTTGHYIFTLTVSDGTEESSDTVMVSINNYAPVVDAGTDRVLVYTDGYDIPFTGASVSDLEDETLSCVWTSDTPSVTLDNPDSVEATFSAYRNLYFGDYTFTLTATDLFGWSCSDQVTITVDEIKISPLTGENYDNFGDRVDISDDGKVIIAGCKNEEVYEYRSGAAYIYQWNGTNWIETKLDGEPGDDQVYFGYDVALSADGETAVVGAYRDQENGSSSGAIYIFKWDGSSWSKTKKIASDGATSDYFGCNVSVTDNGERIVAGAFGADGNGAAYIYDWNGSSWVETKLTASDGAAGDYFGWSVSVTGSGQTIAVGAYYKDSRKGSLYIYDWNGSSWVETIINASDGVVSDDFGQSVSLSGDGHTVVTGSKGDDDNGSYSGSIYVYNWNGTSWDETKITASDGADLDMLGSEVSLSTDGETIISSSYEYNDNRVYVFSWNGTSWVETILVSSDLETGDGFGCDVSVSGGGDFAIVGSWRDDGPAYDTGSVYIYQLQ